MSYTKLSLQTAHPILSWANHEMSSEELTMLKNMANLPCVFHHVALMADAHLGKGSMIGSVIASKNAVIPASVGVDIGCGMCARKTPFYASDLQGKEEAIRAKIESSIPLGFHSHKTALPEAAEWDGWRAFKDLHPSVQKLRGKAMEQLGTLGSGNHFIEICLDTENAVWVMLHSGSRNIGKELADAHITAAKSLFNAGDLPDKNLAYFTFGSPEFDRYWNDLLWAQRYAEKNRDLMMAQIMKILADELGQAKPVQVLFSVNCHHNYAAKEWHFGEHVFVTRKGAVRAGASDYGIIPGSMGSKSFIVKGKGNEASFASCSHGAGRKMSRAQAKKRFTTRDLERQTSGILCRKDSGILDEIPEAYKDIETVMQNQSDLVEILAELHQIVCIKG
ncbi:protein of unknown function UPF0027 [Chloroherpeton thalassium ATCC 35110]|uniref:3'-phosphate/5'-hydroxy nucleic acid ligase n=1 Tax=Chloroherpeton thalassium (strain ATCC 35110 / GB-78) TaxID=517418 RepID=B3QUS8_CHLT3|nr:RtcB family protein [Chloroherpeton thalassium]ACF14429.1 protein of unknown function UPF0027 [Chloroherpeton thalassium ATCC 35110]